MSEGETKRGEKKRKGERSEDVKEGEREKKDIVNKENKENKSNGNFEKEGDDVEDKRNPDNKEENVVLRFELSPPRYIKLVSICGSWVWGILGATKS